MEIGSQSSGPTTRASFNGDNSIQTKWLSGLLCFVKSTCFAELSADTSVTTASDQFKIFIVQEPQETHFPRGSIIPSWAKNNWFSKKFSKLEPGEGDEIFQNPIPPQMMTRMDSTRTTIATATIKLTTTRQSHYIQSNSVVDKNACKCISNFGKSIR